MKILQQHPQLDTLGIREVNRIYWQLNTPQLYEEAVQRHEGYVAHLGPLVVRTGSNTALTYNDRFIVSESPTQASISWGELNRPFDSNRFDALQARITAYFQGLDTFVQDVYVRTGREQQMSLRIITETAWHNLFARNTYLPADYEEGYEDFRPEYTVIHAPGFRASPQRDGTNSDVFVIIHLSKRLILVGGTSYAGEIKKAIFSVLNYLLPGDDVLTLECAANVGPNHDVALFVGAPESGKTVLATVPERTLIGDSEHGWDGDGIFSIGRGGYAHTLGLDASVSSDLYEVTRRFGTIMENVCVNVHNRRLKLDEGCPTDNARANYPLTHIHNYAREGYAGHPSNIILLTNDAFGVLPPVSLLSLKQAYYYYLSGYSAELRPTRYGDLEPQATFSSCYGAPFMPLHPGYYADMFLSRIKQHHTRVWLVNTGWVGGPYGKGQRIRLSYTRAIINAILDNTLMMDDVRKLPHFDLSLPVEVPGVPDEILDPRQSWADHEAFDAIAIELMHDFDANYAQYDNEVDPAILSMQPRFN